MTEAGDRTVDAFHRGRFHILQPRHGGHRAGMDAMMLAAAVPTDFAGTIADLGAGSGAAAFAVLSRTAANGALLVENAPLMAAFARETLALPENAALSAKARVIEADVTLTGAARVAAGLPDRSADFVIMNPPFNRAHDRITPAALRAAAHVMDAGGLEPWFRTAAAMVRPDGRIAVILRAELIGEALAGLAGRFGGLEIKPIHPRADTAAIRVVLRGRRGARAPTVLLPPLVLHEDGSDRFSPVADIINNGGAGLFGD